MRGNRSPRLAAVIAQTMTAAHVAAKPLPCLSGNKSDKRSLSRLRKSAFSVAENAIRFVEKVGLEKVGFLTVTFPAEVKSPREAQRRWNNFCRRVVSRLFGQRVRALEPHSDGRPHSHSLIDCGGDIRTGFDWEHYDRVRAWSKDRLRSLAAKPRGSLNRRPHLVWLHSELRRLAPLYGIGRVELIPLRSTGEAVGRYVGGYLSKGTGRRRGMEWKGVRHVSYTRRCPRAIKGPWAWAEHGRRWRRQLARWAAKHGCATMEEISAVFGPRWCYHHSPAIAATDPDAPAVPAPISAPISAPSAPAGRAYTLRRRLTPEIHWQRPLKLSG